MAEQDVIRVACHRTGSNWPSETSSNLAAAVVQPVAFEPLTWFELRNESISNGGDRADLAQLYNTGGFFDLLRASLEAGDWAGIQDLKEDAGDVVTLSTPTKQAIVATLDAHKLRLIDVVAGELGEIAPETVSATQVDSALGR